MTVTNPYADAPAPSTWLRGNLHAHTTRSDGRQSPQEVLDAYAALGYDFLAISDHDIFSGPDEYVAWDSRGMVLLPGNEVTAGGVHLLHTDGDRRVDPDPDRQKVLDTIAATRGFAVINHPNWYARYDHCPQSSLETWTGYAGIEIYNGVIEWLEGSPYALDRWDMLLSAGRRVWGFAHDDSHFAEGIGRGWNVVAAGARTPSAIVDALKAGRFYASTGVHIDAIEVDGTTITVRAENAGRITASTRNARRLASVDGPELSVDAAQGEGYVRFTGWGAGESFAWTQPFWLDGE